MNKELERRIAAIPEVEPDEEDRKMLLEAAQEDDGSQVDYDDFIQGLEGYSGRLSVRIPRSLHKQLSELAGIEGVSLNQYVLYKLAR